MTKKILFVLVVVIVLAFAVIGVLKFQQKSHQAGTTNYERTGAQPGLVVQGFPISLVMFPSGKIDDSYKLVYPDKSVQYTAVFKTSKNIADEYNLYLNYLKGLGYQISNQTQDAKSANLYARNASTDISVLIAAGDSAKTPTVTVTYLRRK